MNGLSIIIDSVETTSIENPPFPVPFTPSSHELTSPRTATRTSFRTRTVEAAQERLWDELSSLYNANQQLKSDPTSKDKDGGVAEDIASKLDGLLDKFMTGADAVLNELSLLGNMHPVLAIAIFAFHEVVKLDIARRENNKKVLVVIMQMQSMMGPMFQLRNLNRDHMPQAERDFHESRLKELAECITRDIKACRSDISHFIDRKFMFKLVLAKGYEKKFATHMEIFALRRSELQSVISEYLAVGMSTANIAIAEVGQKLNVMDDKIEAIMTKLFRNLDTQREREVFKFMQQNGGPEKCVNDLDLLPKLISKAGEHNMPGSTAFYDQRALEVLQKQLREALAEDLDKVLEKHYSRFEKILQVQSNNLKSMSTYLEDQGVLMQVHATKLGKILDTVTTIMVMEEGKVQTKAVKLKDPEIQRVWNRMNLTSSSVKAKVFVLTFRDHIRSDNSAAVTPLATEAPLPGDQEAEGDVHQPSALDVPDKESDEWVLDYIDVAYVQPIVEAMDEDGSGFISVKEANSFALARPKGLSLLHWIAYWAAGWHMNLVNHKKEIYSLLLQMYELLPSVHVANRKWVDDYLDNRSLRRVEALLRSIKPLPDSGRKEPKLAEVANMVASSQLERLEKNLTEMGYSIESAADATAIGGSARIETWILPLVILLLRRHLKIIQLAKSIVLHSEEFDVHTTSLASIFMVFHERMANVEAKFRQLHSNVNAQFENFAHGMFLAAFKKTEMNISDNTLLTLKMDEYITPGTSGSSVSGVVSDLSILAKSTGPLLGYEELDLPSIDTTPTDDACSSMWGDWSGAFITTEALRDGWKDPFVCAVQPSGDNSFAAQGETYFGTFEITNGKFAGESEASSEGRIVVTFDIPQWSETYQGTYNQQRGTIEGFFWNKQEEVVEQGNDNDESANTTSPEVLQASATSDVEEIGVEDNNKLSPVAEQMRSEVTTAEKIENEKDREPPAPLQASCIETEALGQTVEPTENGTPDEAKPVTDGNGHGLEKGDSQDKTGDDVQTQTSIPEVSELQGSGAAHESESQDQEPTATAANQEDDPEPEPAGRFYMTRCPPDTLRFRYLLDGPSPIPCWPKWPIARKRWAFAVEAVLYQTRLRMGSRKAFLQVLGERRKWLNYCQRYNLSDSNLWSRWDKYEPLTDAEWEEYRTMLSDSDPRFGRLNEKIGMYLTNRGKYSVGFWLCDACTKNLAFTRYLCIVCMEEDLSHSIDLCDNCFDKPDVVHGAGNFNHIPSHSLLRSRRFIHNFEMRSLMAESRLISERSKNIFRTQERNTKERKEHNTRKPPKGKASRKQLLEKSNDDISNDQGQICACCGEPVSLPCWVCVSCSPLTFICDACDRKSLPVTQGGRNHSRVEHLLLRIRDSVEVKPIKTSDTERQLDQINLNISALEDKVRIQLEESKEMKLMVNEVAKTIGVHEDDGSMISVGMLTDDEFDNPSDVEEPKEIEAAAEEKDDTDMAKDISEELESPTMKSGRLSGEEEKGPTSPSKIRGKSMTQMDLMARLALLETAVQSTQQNNQALDDKYTTLSMKIDALEAKIDKQFEALLAGIQQLLLPSSSR